ncbi:hypothetical protein LSH36_781g00028 [Paralvinella palmiformis]|uniref:Uncharacterized protein n=1 Tax=Paralvinella palmiformis TaxID=53620 RepID=A0AAD9J1B6_9ANNE|nr:hypothetical protein LSH36_781g00028 [Paralvinella palmiformis]
MITHPDNSHEVLILQEKYKTGQSQ